VASTTVVPATLLDAARQGRAPHGIVVRCGDARGTTSEDKAVNRRARRSHHRRAPACAKTLAAADRLLIALPAFRVGLGGRPA